MLLPRTRIIILACIAALCGCTRHTSALRSNQKIAQLRRQLYTYMIGPGHEPIDTPENGDAILRLLKEIEPLDRAEKINLALDVFEYYDATDNLASGQAREMLIEYGEATLPLVRDRLASAINPEEMRDLTSRIEKRLTRGASRPRTSRDR